MFRILPSADQLPEIMSALDASTVDACLRTLFGGPSTILEPIVRGDERYEIVEWELAGGECLVSLTRVYRMKEENNGN